MFLRSGRAHARTHHSLLRFVLIAPLLVLSVTSLYAQGGTDYTGTGGRQTIQGRIFFPSGRRVDTSIKVTLESITTGNLSVFVDSYGAFSFRNLVSGSYTIVIDASDYYEGIRETVIIDGGGTAYVRSTPTVTNVQLVLQPKRAANSGKPGVLNAALAGVPKQALELYDKGLESGQAGDARKAIDYFNGALKLYPEFPLALNELGVQYLNLKETDHAIDSFRAALKYSPDDFTPHLNLGIALYSKNQIAESETQLREALKKNKQSWPAHMYLGLARLKLQDYDEAEKELLQALVLGGDNLSLPHYYLGGIYWGRRDYKRAADELEKYVKLAPKAPNNEQTRNAIKELRRKQK